LIPPPEGPATGKVTAEEVPTPDVTGTYTEGDPYAGYPTYKHDTLDWWIWFDATFDGYALSNEIGNGMDEGKAYWYCQSAPPDPNGDYAPRGTAVGDVNFALDT